MAGETGTVQITIPNLEQFQNALLNFSQVAIPIVNTAILQGAAILATNTVPPNVPWKTGNLARTFALQTGNLFARWYPTASYRGYVYWGTGIYGPRKQGWTQNNTFGIPGFTTKHLGQHPNPYLDQISDASQDQIMAAFQSAIERIIATVKQ